MKRNSLTVLVGVLLLAIFGLLLFTFQVRQTEIALVTTFDRPSRYITEPGFQFKWPPPIQTVYKFDKRIQTLDYDKIDQTLTSDSLNLIVQVYMGWSISDPKQFFSSFPSGTVEQAQPALEDLVRGVKLQVIPQHPFTDFVSTDPKELTFTQIENEMLQKVRPIALKNYGVTVHFLGIKKLGLPESVTAKVFERMGSERKKVQQQLLSFGDRDAKEIKSDADQKRNSILAEAAAKALVIKGEADAEAAKSFAVMNQEPEFAGFLYKVKALEQIGKERTAWFLDPRTPPFDLLTSNFLQNAVSRPVPGLTTNTMATVLEDKPTAKNSP
jgi:membrane protease subunit HflC